MADLYKIIDELLKEKGISGAKMSSDLGMSRSFMTELRKGRAKSIKTETAKRIADYFGVSTDYLLGNVSEPYFHLDDARILSEINSYGDEEKKAPTENGGRQVTDDDIKFALFGGDKELMEYLEVLKTRPECRMLFKLTKDASKADVEKAVAIVEALRRTEER